MTRPLASLLDGSNFEHCQKKSTELFLSFLFSYCVTRFNVEAFDQMKWKVEGSFDLTTRHNKRRERERKNDAGAILDDEASRRELGFDSVCGLYVMCERWTIEQSVRDFFPPIASPLFIRSIVKISSWPPPFFCQN